MCFLLTACGNILRFSLICWDNYVALFIEFWSLIYGVKWIRSQSRLLNYDMSGIKLLALFTTLTALIFHVFVWKIILKYCWFFVWYVLIFECLNDTSWKSFIKIYYLEIWIYLVRYLTQDLRLSTHLFIRTVCLINCLSKLKQFCVTHCWMPISCPNHSIRHMIMLWQTISHPILHVNAPLVHSVPLLKESV